MFLFVEYEICWFSFFIILVLRFCGFCLEDGFFGYLICGIGGGWGMESWLFLGILFFIDFFFNFLSRLFFSCFIFLLFKFMGILKIFGFLLWFIFFFCFVIMWFWNFFLRMIFSFEVKVFFYCFIFWNVCCFIFEVYLE